CAIIYYVSSTYWYFDVW
nr:immunoglobulin heavy chain junction region [Mus musculus]